MTNDYISFLSKRKFPDIFNSFSESISDICLPRNEDSDIILEYIEIFCKKQNTFVIQDRIVHIFYYKKLV